MRMTLRDIPLVLIAALLAHVGCGEATHVLVESQALLVTASDTLPKNLVSRSELVVAAADGGVTVVVENVTVTVRQEADGRSVATVSASGVLHAGVPVDILLFEVLMAPSHARGAWIERADASVPSARHPAQLAAGEEGRWHWQTRATTDEHISEGLVVRVRLVYEALV